MSTAGEEVWTTGQAAAYLKDLGVNRRQVYRMVEAGELPAIQRGGHKWHRIPARAVRAYRQALLAQLAPGDHAGEGR